MKMEEEIVKTTTHQGAPESANTCQKLGRSSDGSSPTVFRENSFMDTLILHLQPSKLKVRKLIIVLNK